VISDATTNWEDADVAQLLHNADANSIDCHDLDSGNTRRYKSRIRVSDGSDTFGDAFSDGVNFDKDCLAESGLSMSDAPDATEHGEVGMESTAYSEDDLVFCLSRAYEPGWPPPGGRMYAQGWFKCSRGITGITYIRTRLVREIRRNYFRVEGNTATWFRTEDGRRSDLFASCKTAQSSRNDYWTVTREWVERPNGEKYGEGTLWGPGVIRSLKCV